MPIDWSIFDEEKKKKRGVDWSAFEEGPEDSGVDWSMFEGDDVSSDKDWQDFTKGEAMWYVGQKGFADTWRGGKQLLGIDEEEMAEEQKIVNNLIDKHGGMVTGSYFAGMILDPAGWFIPATKARTAAKMAMYGAGLGTAAGALGYVDPEGQSLVGEGGMSRPEQAVLGGATGAVITPFLGKMMQLGKKGYAPVGEKVWQATAKNPEIGTGIAGGMVGYNWGEDTTFDEDMTNAMKGTLIGMSSGAGLRGVNKLTEGGLARFFIPETGVPDEYLRLKGINRADANRAVRKFNDVVGRMQGEKKKTRELMYQIISKDDSVMAPGRIAKHGYRVKYEDMGKVRADGSPVSATADHTRKTVSIDRKAAKEVFDRKGWTAAKVEGVDPLSPDAFKTYEEWEKFLLEHELAHLDHPRMKGESRGDYENRVNQAALARIDNPFPDVDSRILEMTDDARRVMDEYGKDLVDLGILKENTWAKNRDAYIHRVYKNPDYYKTKDIFKSVYGSDDIRFIGDEMKMRGNVERILKDEWNVDKDIFLDDPSWDIIRASSGGEKLYSGEVTEDVIGGLRRGTLDPDEVIVRRDWTPEERAQMGEVTDAAMALFRTGQLMSNDVAAHRFFKAVADEYSVVKPPPSTTKRGSGYTLVPNNRMKYGALADRFLPDNMYHDIVTMDWWRSGQMFKNPIARAYRGVNNWWKLTKTAYNLPVHFNNFGSNIVMYDLNGGSLRGFRQAVKDLTFPTKRGESARLAMAREYDVFGGNYIGNEVLQKNKNLFRAYDTAADTGIDTVDSILEKTPDLLRKVGRTTKRWSLDKFQELYTWEDNVFRMGLFNTLIDQGLDPALAARRAREGFVDYSKSAPALEILRNTALPFASYAYGIVPRLGEAAAKTPWKFAKWAAIMGGLNALGEDLSNDSEKFDRQRQLLGPGQSGQMFDAPGMPSTMLKLPPFLSPKGPKGTKDDYYLNYNRQVPGQAFQHTTQGFRIPGLPDVLQPNFGSIGGVVMPMMGINMFTGEKIEDTSDRLKEVGRQFIPNLPIPGLGTYAGTKMSRGLQPGGFVSETKENQTLLTAIMQNLGLRVQAVNIDKLTQSQNYRLKDKWNNLRKKHRTLQRDLEEGRYMGREKVFQREQKKLEQEAINIEKYATRLGL